MTKRIFDPPFVRISVTFARTDISALKDARNELHRAGVVLCLGPVEFREACDGE
jgi:hypothetical protein